MWQFYSFDMQKWRYMITNNKHKQRDMHIYTNVVLQILPRPILWIQVDCNIIMDKIQEANRAKKVEQEAYFWADK